MRSYVFICFLFCITTTSSEVTPVVQCIGQQFDNLQERIEVSPCGKGRCKLSKGTNTTVTFKFRPKNPINTLTNDVFADIAGLPLPFLGVTGSDVCPYVTRAEDGTPSPCPLAADQEYVYTNVIPVEAFYPQVNLRVHWALNDGTSDVICFEVPAIITGGKRKLQIV
ncbi:unnamed protein product [Leptosia nina]|uniref:MD-2-related lipid-recognition domain-containing protein n=1 Tax=Leptosia nina TaxID=320188 RepID=A0AAV1JMG7_9NEOP